MTLHFDPESHTYHLDGARLPNVTTIMKPIIDYSMVPPAILEAARARGEYVHRACELLLFDDLDEASVPDEFYPYICAFKLFMEETQFEPELIEKRVYHAKLRYAGTVDLAGTFPPVRKNGREKRALIDIKSTFTMLRSVGPQTAAYADAWASHNPKELHYPNRYGLRLKDDGNYELLPFTSPTDMNAFHACLVLYNYMREK